MDHNWDLIDGDIVFFFVWTQPSISLYVTVKIASQLFI